MIVECIAINNWLSKRIEEKHQCDRLDTESSKDVILNCKRKLTY